MSFIASKFNFATSSFTRIFSESSTIQIRNYAARKGTRERKMKKKVKHAVVEKVGFIPHNVLKKQKLLASRPSRKVDDSWKRLPTDNVYAVKYYQWNVYPFSEVIQSHRETHHAQMYNVPNANLHVTVELNMQGEKKTRFVDDFTRIVAVPHKFEHGEERSLIAFAKDIAIQQEAVDAGAQLAGGVDLIKQIQSGAVDLNNFQFAIAHPDILPELVTLRGLMKRKLPNPRNGTLDVDLAGVTSRFLHGIRYVGKKDEYEKDFGLVETVIGTLDMDGRFLEENFRTLLQDLYALKPRREGHFISRCLLWSPPSREKLKVDHKIYLPAEKKNVVGKKVEDDEEEAGERVAL